MNITMTMILRLPTLVCMMSTALVALSENLLYPVPVFDIVMCTLLYHNKYYYHHPHHHHHHHYHHHILVSYQHDIRLTNTCIPYDVRVLYV